MGEGVGQRLAHHGFARLRGQLREDLAARAFGVEQVAGHADVLHVHHRRPGGACRLQQALDLRGGGLDARQAQVAVAVLVLRVDDQQGGLLQVGGRVAAAGQFEQGLGVAHAVLR
ncbi:hypothetical protein D3C78_1332070 [compost metagenome]